MSRLGLMLDVETLGVSSQAVVTEVAMIPFDMYDEDRFSDHVGEYRDYLPLDPQVATGAICEASTIKFWMEQDNKARLKMANRLAGDAGTLARALERAAHTILTWRNSANADLTQEQRDAGESNFELWAKGPQFDVMLLERLLSSAGIRLPWVYHEVRDLRTLIKEADLNLDTEVTKPVDYVQHSAKSDCRFQIASYYAARKKLGGRSAGIPKSPISALRTGKIT